MLPESGRDEINTHRELKLRTYILVFRTMASRGHSLLARVGVGDRIQGDGFLSALLPSRQGGLGGLLARRPVTAHEPHGRGRVIGQGGGRGGCAIPGRASAAVGRRRAPTAQRR